MRRFTAAVAATWAATRLRRASRPGSWPYRRSRTITPTGRPSASIGAMTIRRAPFRSAASAGSVARSSRCAVTGSPVCPGPLDDRVDRELRSRLHLDAAGGEHDEARVAAAEDEPAGERVAGGEAVEDRARLAGRVALVIEQGADPDHGLEVGPALAEVALVQRPERPHDQREHPQRREAQPTGRRRRATGGDERAGGSDADEQHGLPGGHRQADPGRPQQGDGEQLEIDEELERARRSRPCRRPRA